MQFEFLMKEIIGTSTLQALIYPCPKYLGLERLGFLVHESPCSSQESLGECRTPRNFVLLFALQGTHVPIIVKVVMNQMK